MVDGVIIKGVGGAYTVATERGRVVCNARGVFRNQSLTPLVGDYVEISVADTPDSAALTGTLRQLKPRKNELRRPRIANIDRVVITLAADKPAFNAGLLDRYLLIAEQTGIAAIICINKSDLCPGGLPAAMTEPYSTAGYPLLAVSAARGEGLDALRLFMREGLSVFAGPSGTGKSSLINRLARVNQAVGDVSSRIGRGRHTTRHTEMLPLTPSGYVADTPGFSSLETPEVPAAALAALFREIAPFAACCRFADCLHINEDGCAVKAQIGAAIHPARYQSYRAMLTGRGVHGGRL